MFNTGFIKNSQGIGRDVDAVILPAVQSVTMIIMNLNGLITIQRKYATLA